MSTVLKAPPITIEQYEHFQGYPGLRDELLYGEIVMSPHPKPLHQQIGKRIERLLDEQLKQTPFVANRDTNIKFESVNSMPSPDVFVVLRSDWKEACQTDRYLSAPPLLAIEILSPANRRMRVIQKTELYLSHGVASVWVVSPKKQTLAVHQRNTSLIYEQGQAIRLLPPLTGQIALVDIFRFE